MKKQVLILALILVSSLNLSAQTTRIVDNNPNGIGDFTSLSAAITAASSGDILLIVPSATSYGNVSFTSSGKKLTLAGGGANGATGLYTKLGAISLNGGSAGNTNLDGFVMGGFECESIDVNFVDSVKIKSVKTTAVITSTNYQLRVRNSVGAELEFFDTKHALFQGNEGLVVYHGIFTIALNTNLVEVQTTNKFTISNSVFINNSYSQNSILIDQTSEGSVVNSAFASSVQIQQMFNFGGAVDVINNIFVHPTYGNYRMVFEGGKSYSHNTVYDNYGFGYVTNNTPAGIFVLKSDGTPDQFQNVYGDPKFNVDTFALTDGSSAIDSGSGNDLDGTIADRGVFGGLDPMPKPLPNAAVGVSVVPSITSLSLSLPTAVSGGKVILKVTGQSKKN